MEIHSDYVEPAVSVLSYENVSFSKAEDSGYRTLTPGSLETAEISGGYLDQPVITQGITGITGQIQVGYFHVTPEVNIQLNRRYNHSTANSECLSETPPYRRGCKRPFSSTTEKTDSGSSVATPTSLIAGKIKSLDVNENKENADILSPISSQCSDTFKKHILFQHNFEQILAYPTTPVKKNCKQSPCRKSARRSNFVIHSLSCDSNALQTINNSRACKAARTINFWPDQKIDIIKKLYHEAVAVPPVMQILSYLSNEDIRNFSLVSVVWRNIWKSVSQNNSKKKDFEGYLKTVKGNQENRDKCVTPKVSQVKSMRHFREIHNEVHDKPTKITSRTSPPVSPKTNRFKRFTKSASLDSRSQMPCVRCSLPAKVNEETSGEVWVDCTSNFCQYQFCKFCKCQRHPGKFCFQYDLNGPSPSKRKKTQYAIGTKKSRRNLMRL